MLFRGLSLRVIHVVVVAALVLLCLPSCESERLVDKFTREGKLKREKPKKEPHPIKTLCVIPSQMDSLRDGMQLFYGYKSEEASDWFKSKCYNTTVGVHSDLCGCFFWGFRAHSTANRTALARTALDAALEIAPYDSKLLSVKGELVAEADMEFEKAAEIFQMAAMYESKNGDDYDKNVMRHYYNAATAYVQISRAEDAIRMYYLALDTEAGRKKWSMHNSIGLLLYDLERYDEAIEAYEKALEIESDQTAVLRNLAGVYFKLGNFSASIPLLRISAVRDPSSFEAWYYLGAAYFELGQYNYASSSLRNATRLNPNSTMAHKMAAEACAYEEEYAWAIKHYKEAHKLLKGQSLYGGCDVLSGLGQVYMEIHEASTHYNTLEP